MMTFNENLLQGDIVVVITWVRNKSSYLHGHILEEVNYARVESVKKEIPDVLFLLSRKPRL